MEKEPKTSLEKTGIDRYKGLLYLWMHCFLVSLWSNARKKKGQQCLKTVRRQKGTVRGCGCASQNPALLNLPSLEFTHQLS